MIIALFGPPGAGKDTVGKILVEQYAYRRVAFADKVRELALKLHGDEMVYCEPNGYCMLSPMVELFGWEYVKRNSEDVRKILERVGDGCREVLGANVWINAAFSSVSVAENVVVTDVRKRNEVEWLTNHAQFMSVESAIWHITRNGCVKRPFDEWQLEWATATIENNGTVEELAAKVRELMNGLTSPPANPSQC